MNKRILLIAIGLLACALALFGGYCNLNADEPLCITAPPEVQSGPPLFSFVFLADLHTGGALNPRPDAPLTNLVVQDILEERNFKMPDFLIIGGDLGKRTDPDLYRTYAIVKEAFNKLPIPYYAVRGNHEVNESYWNEAFPNRNNYYFLHKGKGQEEAYLFVMIDWPHEAKRTGWLNEVLAAHPDNPTIITVHIPPLKMNVPWAEESRCPELKDTIEAHDQVVAVLSGHIHCNDVKVEHGIYYITTFAIADGCCPENVDPIHGYRHFEVYPDRIEVRTYQVGGGLLSSVDNNTCVRKHNLTIPVIRGRILFASHSGEQEPGGKQYLWKHLSFNSGAETITVKIVGSAKAGQKNPPTDDDDLKIVIDDCDYGWNSALSLDGWRDWGKTKVLVIKQRLEAGSHNIKIYAEGSPTLDSLIIYKSPRKPAIPP